MGICSVGTSWRFAVLFCLTKDRYRKETREDRGYKACVTLNTDMNYIVFDLEWNQSASGRVIKNQYGKLPFEIIEIGAVKLNDSLKIVSSFDRMIKPQVYLKLHKAVEKLLPITMRDLMKGESFEAACREFFEWCGKDPVFVTWGDADLLQLQRNMNFFNIHYDLEKPLLFIDAQRIYSEQFLDGVKCVSLSVAVDALKVPKGKSYHRAVYDAQYTALAFTRLDPYLVKNHYSIDTYDVPKDDEDEICLTEEDIQQYVSKGFKTREEASDNRVLKSNRCFLCDRNMRRLVNWFCDNGKNYYAAFSCKEHGKITGKYKVKCTDDGRYYGVRTLTLSDDRGVDEIKEKKKKEVERARQKEELAKDQDYKQE